MARSLSIALLWFTLMTILASINARGIRSSDRRKLAFQYFIRKRFDIICLQETYWSEDLKKQIKREWEGDSFFAHRTENSLEAIKVQTKARFIEEGEKSTRYFFSLEKSRRADHTIRVLSKESLDTVSDTKGLLSESYAFYKKLYSVEVSDCLMMCANCVRESLLRKSFE